MREYTGHTVVNGELRFASVSAVKMFDARTKGGCARRWAYKTVFGIKEAEADKNKAAKEKGIALDKELKHYLQTGDKALSPLALRGLHILEAPGTDVHVDIAINTVEHWLNGVRVPSLPEGERYPDGTQHVVRSQLMAAGVPFLGELDLAHARGHYRDEDGQYHDDPPGTVEVGDIKYKGNSKDRNGNSTLMLPNDLIRDIQMAGYGEWISRVDPHASYARLSLLYFPDKEGSKQGVARKVTKLHVLEDCHKTWARVEATVREMKDVAKATDIEQVPGASDLSTCDAYSGCPHREYCTAYKKNSLDKTYGKLAADVVNNSGRWGVQPAQPLSGQVQMGIIANNPQLMNQAQPAPMQQQLAAEEQQLRQQAAQQQGQMPSAQQNQSRQVAEVCQKIIGYGYGFPALVGNAAQTYAALGGQNVAPDFVYNGNPAPAGAKRTLHSIRLAEIQHLFQLEAELAAEAGVPAYGQPGAHLGPQNMPAAVQAPPPQQPNFTQQLQQAYAQQTQPAPFTGVSAGAGGGHLAPGILPPDAPASMPQLAMQQSAPPQGPGPAQQPAQVPQAQTGPDPMQQGNPPAEQPKKTRGRPKNQDSTPAVSTAPVQGTSPIPSAPQQQAPAGVPSASPSTGACVILVNARMSNAQTTSLNEYVDYINRSIATKYNVGADGRPGILDVRAALKDTVLAFGGWKGVVREVVKQDPPPVGQYHLDTFMDDLNEAVADALRVVADERGWTYVRGMRG